MFPNESIYPFIRPFLLIWSCQQDLISVRARFLLSDVDRMFAARYTETRVAPNSFRTRFSVEMDIIYIYQLYVYVYNIFLTEVLKKSKPKILKVITLFFSSSISSLDFSLLAANRSNLAQICFSNKFGLRNNSPYLLEQNYSSRNFSC